MAKRKNLNGLPNNLIQQYFSTLFYWDGGYMADWIWNAMNEKSISKIQIDILNDIVLPNELQIKQITTYINRLRETIQKELTQNGFEINFITNANFEIEISSKYLPKKILSCTSKLIDAEGKVYQSNVYLQEAFIENFRVFKFQFISKFKE